MPKSKKIITPGERWEKGMDHHPKSLELYKKIEDFDFQHNNDYFCFKSGGDGDNGEQLMYLLDMIFEEEDQK
jgi:hypothetical protein